MAFTGLSLQATRAQNAVAEQGQLTDRFTKAVDQLDRGGPEHLQARLGAIYALERLARDSLRDHPTVIEVLSAFIRTTDGRIVPESGDVDVTARCPDRPVTADVQAALTVLGRRDTTRDQGNHLNLPRTCLLRADLRGVNLHDANLQGANLRDADLGDANLTGANLIYADLDDADLGNADLGDADVASANLTGANLIGANLRDALLDGANLDDAFLDGADLTNAILISANLTNADLTGANLTRAELEGANLTNANLTNANLTDARRDGTTLVNDVIVDERTQGVWWR